MTVIGYGVREPIPTAIPQPSLSNVLCPAKPRVASIDTNIWWVLDGPRPDEAIIDRHSWAFCRLWYSLDTLLQYCDAAGLRTLPGHLIAVGAPPETLKALAEGGRTPPVAQPDLLEATGFDWTFLGFDITDPDFYSHLSSTGWARHQDESRSAQDWCQCLNENHLCSSLKEAALVMDAVRRSPLAISHLPPLPFGLFMSTQW